jgi:iron complex transport system substrate-binding protein
MTTIVKLLLAGACAIALHVHASATAAITVLDDDGKPVTLQKPAMRVIALAPHATELVYAAGGASRIVAVSEYSDYPEQAKQLPRVGDSRQFDMERIAVLRPDLVVVWLHGSSERQIDQIRALGIPIFQSEPTRLDSIASSVSRLGKLMGTETVAEAAADGLRKQLAGLKARYAGRSPVRLFYQISDKPLYTLNGEQIVSDALRLCGAENIFAHMTVKAPSVSIEAVLQENPEAIVSGGEGKVEGGVAMWKGYSSMTAVRRDNLFRVNGNLLNRAGPRMIAGTASLCEKIELARQHRNKP